MWSRKSTPALPAVAIRPSIAAFQTDRPREWTNAEVISAPAPFARTYLLDMIDGCLSAQLLNAVCIRRPSLMHSQLLQWRSSATEPWGQADHVDCSHFG